jgi:hypothetical protein
MMRPPAQLHAQGLCVYGMIDRSIEFSLDCSLRMGGGLAGLASNTHTHSCNGPSRLFAHSSSREIELLFVEGLASSKQILAAAPQTTATINQLKGSTQCPFVLRDSGASPSRFGRGPFVCVCV